MRIISKVIFTLLLSSVVCSVFARGGDRHWTVKCDKDQKGYSMTGKAGSGDYTCLPKKKLWIFPEKDSYVTATCAAPAPNGHAG